MASSSDRRRRVGVLYVGGTVGMKRAAEGYVPEPGYLAQLLADMPELRHPAMPEHRVVESGPLLDSSNMSPDDWLRVARDIVAMSGEFDGCVVLHGTDTMAYTASALAFLLEGLRTPVVLTGSQIPLCELRNDARKNVVDALMIAADPEPIPEVALCFGGRLLRGCRSTKVSAKGFEAFASPNYPALGRVGVTIELKRSLALPPPPVGESFRVRELTRSPHVGALRLFPGIRAELVRNALRPPLEGLVLEAYGVGNGPVRDKDFLDALREASDRGVVVVDVTQCLEGAVKLDEYATGTGLAKAGVVGGADMTAEAALAKLYVALGSGMAPDEARRAMRSNQRGELSEPGGAFAEARRG